jgi:uncharacterized damage-inducible protein DinB
MSLKDSFAGELKHEASMTKKILERVPWDQKNWKPHNKSMSIGRLATHIAEIPRWVTDILSADETDFAKRPFKSYVASSNDELIKLFSDNVEEAISGLLKADDAAFDKIWTIKRGEQVIMQTPKKVAIRGWAFSHLFHHRGQLTVFLRLLDVAVPGMYGPSADEKL